MPGRLHAATSPPSSGPRDEGRRHMIFIRRTTTGNIRATGGGRETSTILAQSRLDRPRQADDRDLQPRSHRRLVASLGAYCRSACAGGVSLALAQVFRRRSVSLRHAITVRSANRWRWQPLPAYPRAGDGATPRYQIIDLHHQRWWLWGRNP